MYELNHIQICYGYFYLQVAFVCLADFQSKLNSGLTDTFKKFIQMNLPEGSG